MASTRQVKIPNEIKFSSHPGHGDAAKTVTQFEKVANQTRQFFPAEAQQERHDHNAKNRVNYP